MIRFVAALVAAVSVHHHSSPRSVVNRVFGWAAPTASCFAYLESRFEPWARHVNSNGTVDRGLFQINSVWVGKTVEWYRPGRGVRIKIKASYLFRGRYNARVAWAMSRGGTSWGPWGGSCV